MTFDRANIGFFIAFALIGAILGSALGTLIARLVPALSIIKDSLTGPISLNLEIISFGLNLNLSAVLGLAAGILIFRKI
ncbi:MAG: hypothetical protein MUD12_02350 [Spirochaetes bacterium]|jgi:hypothetical protein|nr:hypothetical protein [Spirochaetota bacterium]